MNLRIALKASIAQSAGLRLGRLGRPGGRRDGLGAVGRAERAEEDERDRDEHGDAAGPPEHLIGAGQPTMELGGPSGHAMIPLASSTTPTPIAVRVSHLGPSGLPAISMPPPAIRPSAPPGMAR